MHNRNDLRVKVTSRVTVEDRGHVTRCWISNRSSCGKGYTKLGYMGDTWLTHRFAYTGVRWRHPGGSAT